jgi:hypothetical protein
MHQRQSRGKRLAVNFTIQVKTRAKFRYNEQALQQYIPAKSLSPISPSNEIVYITSPTPPLGGWEVIRNSIN